METYNVAGIANETFTIGQVEDQSNLKNLAQHMTSKGFEAKIYKMERVVTGRKKSKTIPCFRNASTGEFVSMV